MMAFSFSDSIGSVGVCILLAAFVLNLVNKRSGNSVLYILMNVTGAGLACYASYLIHYFPFVVLEAVWTAVSLVALINYYRRRIS